MDGGQNWVLRGTLEFYVEQLQAVSSDEGWFSSGAFLFHTTDGGMTWTRKEFPNSVRISDMEFIDPEYGWVLAGKELFSTSDGGETWSVNTSPCLSSEAGPVVSFVNEAIGWIGCPSIPGAGSQLKALYRSDDSGGHWTLISNSGLPGGTIAPGHVPAGGYMHDVFFLDELNGWISTTRGGLIKTSDGGLSWTWVSVGEALSVGDEFVTSARFFSLDEGYALVSTHDGVLAHTDDAGATWSVTFPPDYSPLPQ